MLLSQHQLVIIYMEFCQPGKVTQAWVCSFYLGCIVYTWLTAHVADINLQCHQRSVVTV